MIIVTDAIVGEFEQLFDGAISDKSDNELLTLAEQVREKLDFDIFQFITPAPFSGWVSASTFLGKLDALIEHIARNTDARDLADTLADARGVLF